MGSVSYPEVASKVKGAYVFYVNKNSVFFLFLKLHKLTSFLLSPDMNKMLPAVPGTATRLSCSNCKRVFREGQTAFQRKGSAELFCSILCIDGYPSPAVSPAPLKRMCINCSRYGSRSKAFCFAAQISVRVLVIISCAFIFEDEKP